MKRKTILLFFIVFSFVKVRGQSDSIYSTFWNQHSGLINPKLNTGVLADVGEFIYREAK